MFLSASTLRYSRRFGSFFRSRSSLAASASQHNSSKPLSFVSFLNSTLNKYSGGVKPTPKTASLDFRESSQPSFPPSSAQVFGSAKSSLVEEEIFTEPEHEENAHLDGAEFSHQSDSSAIPSLQETDLEREIKARELESCSPGDLVRRDLTEKPYYTDGKNQFPFGRFSYIHYIDALELLEARQFSTFSAQRLVLNLIYNLNANSFLSNPERVEILSRCYSVGTQLYFNKSCPFYASFVEEATYLLHVDETVRDLLSPILEYFDTEGNESGDLRRSFVFYFAADRQDKRALDILDLSVQQGCYTPYMHRQYISGVLFRSVTGSSDHEQDIATALDFMGREYPVKIGSFNAFRNHLRKPSKEVIHCLVEFFPVHQVTPPVYLLPYLCKPFISSHDVVGVVKLIEKCCQLGCPFDPLMLEQVLIAYSIRGDFDGAYYIWESAHQCYPNLHRFHFNSLYRLMLKYKSYSAFKKFTSRVFQENRQQSWLLLNVFLEMIELSQDFEYLKQGLTHHLDFVKRESPGRIPEETLSACVKSFVQMQMYSSAVEYIEMFPGALQTKDISVHGNYILSLLESGRDSDATLYCLRSTNLIRTSEQGRFFLNIFWESIKRKKLIQEISPFLNHLKKIC
eukprot:Sdes_comp18269_c0_seq1m7905